MGTYTSSGLTKKGWKLHNVNEQLVAEYGDWKLYINPLSAYPFSAINPLTKTVRASNIAILIDRIEHDKKTSPQALAGIRTRCKASLTDVRKCDYCGDKFLCYTEKGGTNGKA